MDEQNRTDKAAQLELVAQKLEQLIRLTGATQQEVGIAAGYTSNSMVNQVLKRKGKGFSVVKLKKIAEYFGLPGGYLLDDTKYDDEDIKLLIAVHKMIKEKKTSPNPHIHTIKHLLNVK